MEPANLPTVVWQRRVCTHDVPGGQGTLPDYPTKANMDFLHEERGSVVGLPSRKGEHQTDGGARRRSPVGLPSRNGEDRTDGGERRLWIVRVPSKEGEVENDLGAPRRSVGGRLRGRKKIISMVVDGKEIVGMVVSEEDREEGEGVGFAILQNVSHLWVI